VLTYSQRMREGDVILRCSGCLWSSLSLESAKSATTAAPLASEVLQYVDIPNLVLVFFPT
jgi:hypothetical protein